MMNQRVVVTGMGLVSPLGWSLPDFWDNLTAGRSGIDRISHFDASEFPVQIAAEVRNWSLADVGENPRQWQNAPRQTRLAIGASLLAVRDSQIDLDCYDPQLAGVYLGCGEPFTPFDQLVDRVCDPSPSAAEVTLRLHDENRLQQHDPGMPAAAIAARLNLQSTAMNCIAACVSASQAIGGAAAMIRRGQATTMLCGGAHSCIHELGVTGFSRLSALSKNNDSPQQASRPFDRARDGFVIGEGAAVFVLESEQQARARRAHIYAQISGYGSAQDAYRVTDTHPAGRGCVQAISRAMKMAQLNPDALSYINAHGTGTLLNDKVETLALKAALGNSVYDVPVSSTKSMLGHATTACGAIELAVCLLALQHDAVPPTINYESPDPECDLDYIPNTARDRRCEHVLSNNIGFGGQNAALIVSRYENRKLRASTRAA